MVYQPKLATFVCLENMYDDDPVQEYMQYCIFIPGCCPNPKINEYICLHYCAREVDYLGGDKDAEICTDPASEEMVHYKDALADLVQAVSIAHFLGKRRENV